MFGTKALLQAHIDECGARYLRMAEQQQHNHTQNQLAIQALGIKIDKFVMTVLTASVITLTGLVAYLLVHGVPWKL